ncbi:DUF3881 family protein [Tyzzerella sp. OttesenSCG-928-J15]|nr:DUF3881 family protein [Tyzzerella sp. OttesenSCG-928-J15]
MDVFMRSVGFTRKKFFDDLGQIKKEIIENPDKRVIFGCSEEGTYIEYYKFFGEGIGILARGIMDENENVTIESCEALAVSDYDTAVNKFVVEFVKNQPVIVFEDIGTGNELVFALQNKIDYFRDEMDFVNFGRSVEYSKERGIIKREVNFTAMSVYGSIILPVYKEAEPDEEYIDEEAYYKSLVLRFREGDNEAEELLKIYAEETYNVLGERLQEEDLLSVVEGYFLPMEDDETDYSILGEIVGVSRVFNDYTGDEIIKLSLNITGSIIQLVINSRDLTGYPMIGMRFMGTCRMRGSVIV